jgi:anti-sigma factor RsiW
MMVDNRSVDYLLGALPERERDEFEHEYFSNPSAFERVARTESELLDAYARGRLPPDDRERVERVYLSDPRRRERLRFAKALAAAADADASAAGVGHGPARQWTGWRLAAAVAAALVVAVTAALSIETVRLRRDLASQAAARANAEHALETQLAAERARNDQLRGDLDRARAAGSGAAGADRTRYVRALARDKRGSHLGLSLERLTLREADS